MLPTHSQSGLNLHQLGITLLQSGSNDSLNLGFIPLPLVHVNPWTYPSLLFNGFTDVSGPRLGPLARAHSKIHYALNGAVLALAEHSSTVSDPNFLIWDPERPDRQRR